MNKNIVLVGFAGTGKTTVGRRIAGILGLDFYDTDEYIKKCENMSVYDVISKKGTKYFEGAQRFAVMNICENKPALIATGGSTLKDEYNKTLLKKDGIFVWLKASPETVYENTKNSHNKRHEIMGKSLEEISEILKNFEKDYKDAEITVNVDGIGNADILAEKIIDELNNIL